MVAYSFSPQFREAVATLAKRQTVRAHRKRHARPGEALQLYTAMRTKQCRKLVDVDPICTRVRPIKILTTANPLLGCVITLDGEVLSAPEAEAFARSDGFVPAANKPAARAMAAFWIERHGASLFSGVVIEWAPAQ